MPKPEREEDDKPKRRSKKRKPPRPNWSAMLASLIRGNHELSDEELNAAVQEMLHRHNQE